VSRTRPILIALAITRDPIFFVFIVPGLLLAVASLGGRSTA
jgi:hypothetical protein